MNYPLRTLYLLQFVENYSAHSATRALAKENSEALFSIMYSIYSFRLPFNGELRRI